MAFDLVVLNEKGTAYYDDFVQQVHQAIRLSPVRDLLDRPGGIFLRQGDELSEDDRALLREAARVVLYGRDGSLELQLDRPELPPELPAAWAPAAAEASTNGHPRPAPPEHPALQFENGYGGFTPDGREYVISVQPQTPDQPGHCPLAPWINVLANPAFGCLVSESSLGCTWAGNSQTNRLTPWSNDPVLDTPSEVVYLRDETTGAVWTPTPKPLGRAGMRVRHGHGYSAFEHIYLNLQHEFIVFVAPDEAIKFVCLKLTNVGDRRRHLSATYYADWVLGGERGETGAHVVTDIDATSGAVFARNPYRSDFAERVAFADVLQRPRAVTADRTEFIGRNRTLTNPAALERQTLGSRAGPGLDPCAALQVATDLDPGAACEVVFVLGEAADPVAARAMLQRCRETGRVHDQLASARKFWDDLCSTVQVQTPNAALDLLLNRWLPYQILACRMWGRTAFYQSSGAIGFRDQIQDALALLYAAPHLTREQLIRTAGRQFAEGDVQHWWHPPGGAGVRTRCSDDRLWLPYTTLHYLAVTGDATILDELVPFLTAPLLKVDQPESYGRPAVGEPGSFYEHCARAIDASLGVGGHGLPLIGSCDWNDGFSSVGDEGRGESVWLAWFQLALLNNFAELAESRGDAERARRYRDQANRLRQAVEEHAWDGRWYRRAYFDDGTPLGSASNTECRIDSLAQTWAVMCGQADKGHAHQAMDSVWEMLVRETECVILLFTPPFDGSQPNPGYIAGYLPGVRENGGQYTHAATWVADAFARLGQGERAIEVLNLLNPILASSTPEQARHYVVEPYVLAGDVYGSQALIGRGGWTWYTGSAGWYYRVALESVLGLQIRGKNLRVKPVVPADWPGFSIRFRHRSATYVVTVERVGTSNKVKEVLCDAKRVNNDTVVLEDDGGDHSVRIAMG
jgi:cyclic beta-1,2-glucan synthetase